MNGDDDEAAILAHLEHYPFLPGESEAMVQTLRAGAQYGYGNMIAHLATAWAIDLMRTGLSAEAAIAAATGPHIYRWLVLAAREAGNGDDSGD